VVGSLEPDGRLKFLSAEQLEDSPEAIQARAREAWAAARAKELQSAASPEEIQRLARERWQAYRQGLDADQGAELKEKSARQGQERNQGKDDGQSL
jgi:hypothetical protein